MDDTRRAVAFQYTNYKGESGRRYATPVSIRYGISDWHTTSGWLMLAFDHEKGAEREFALEECQFENKMLLPPCFCSDDERRTCNKPCSEIPF